MDSIDRRRDERRPAAENRASLLWDRGAEVLETPARLVDISRGGASFVADSPPPTGQDICFRLEAPRRTGWVSVRVVRSGRETEGGLSFSGYFPHELIAGLV